MIISDEQARLAADYIRHTPVHPCSQHRCEVPSDVLAQAIEIASHAPDVREERMAEARTRMGTDMSSGEIASKMLSRIVSDALR